MFLFLREHPSECCSPEGFCIHTAAAAVPMVSTAAVPSPRKGGSACRQSNRDICCVL